MFLKKDHVMCHKNEMSAKRPIEFSDSFDLIGLRFFDRI